VTHAYLDHNATSPLRPEAAEAMRRALEQPAANPSSVHGLGQRARMLVEEARVEVARLIGAEPDEIVFTSGGTEANNLALFGAAAAARPGTRRVVISAIEHPSVREAAACLAERGFPVTCVGPDRHGVVPEAEVLRAAGPDTAVVSLMLANNEVGTLQPVPSIAAELRARGVVLHCDAVQAAGKIPIDVMSLGADLLSIAAHKLGGPQGVGALRVRRGLTLRPHLRGGGQEANRRPGTENVAGLAGFGAAARAVRLRLASEGERQAALRDRLEREVLSRHPQSRVNAAAAPRVPNTTSLAFEGWSAEELVIALDLEGVAVSAGSACSAGTMRSSEVLRAMGLEGAARSSIRVSLGHDTRPEEVERFLVALARILARRDAPAGLAARRVG
jgi:cysteine desulfurase